MIITKSLTPAQVQATITLGEFPPEVVPAGRNVAVIMTQSWCGQWLIMQPWIGKEARKQDQPEIDVYVLEYDREPFFQEFLAFKEKVFGNESVPYIRFYKDGRFVRDANAIGKLQFYGVFRDGARKDS